MASGKAKRGSSASKRPKEAGQALDFLFDCRSDREYAEEPVKLTKTRARERAGRLSKPVVVSFVNNPG
jgi:hypothetical protein